MTPEPEALQRAALPTGTVTFLFTDIEGSTQRWEQHREAMKAAVARQEHLLKAAISAHAGYVFKTLGDAFCAAFATAPEALLAAVDAQRALAKEDFSAVDGLSVRMGLHTGYAEERNADYFGPAVNRVARLMSIGHGGQILLSGVTYGLAHSELPAGTKLVDLGGHRLKDLTEPEQVWQLSIEGLPATFGPLRSLDALPNNLPIQRTTFVGRDHDVAEVKGLVNRHRLVTLFGSGGVGKTRIAMQVAADLLDHYTDGVWVADFAPITDPELVSSVIAQVLGMPQQQGHRVDESIPPFLKRKKLVLVFDNCEHVLDAIAAIAATIIGAAPDVRIINTSRQVLDIGGEEIFRVPSLEVPHKIADLTPSAAVGFGAVALFVERAKSVNSSFALTDDNAPIVADICRRLDGIPLAIELAAARVKVLSIPNLAQRLNERFKILTGGGRDALPRQKTLSALIDWSYDLLNPQEQTLFQRLGIFAGGFGLEAATAVCRGDGLDEIEILDLLASLTDKSLVVADTTGQQERYHLLESTRAYALQKMEAGERERLARRHAEHYADKAQDADKRYGSGSTFAWLADVGLELDNYRSALEWSLTQGHDAMLGGVIAGALALFWHQQGLAVEGRYWIESALERVNVAEHAQIFAKLLNSQAHLLGGSRRCEVAARAVEIYESAGDRHGAARARNLLAHGLYQTGRSDEAMKLATETLVIMRELRDNYGILVCLMRQADAASGMGELARARDLYSQALTAMKTTSNEIGMAINFNNLAEVEFADGHPEEALRAVTEALTIDQRRGVDAPNLATDNCNTAAYRIALNDHDLAAVSAREGLRISRQVQNAYAISIALQHLALLWALKRHMHVAARLLGYVDAQYKASGNVRESTEKWGFDKLMSTLREQLSEAEIEKLAVEGAAWSEDQAVEEALKV